MRVCECMNVCVCAVCALRVDEWEQRLTGALLAHPAFDAVTDRQTPVPWHRRLKRLGEHLELEAQVLPARDGQERSHRGQPGSKRVAEIKLNGGP